MSPSESAPRDTRLVPAAVACWVGMWLASSGETWAIIAAAAASVLAGTVAATRRSAAVALVAVVMTATTAAGLLRAHSLTSAQAAVLGRDHSLTEVAATVTGEPRQLDPRGVRPPVTLVPVEATRLSARGQSWSVREPILVEVSGDAAAGWGSATVGSAVVFDARLTSVEVSDGIAARARAVTSPSPVAGPPAWLAAVARVRTGLRTAMTGSSPEQAALVPALTVGDTSAVDGTVTEEFKATGLTHLMAVSGANLTLLLGFVTTLAGWVGVRGRAVLALSVASVVGFVVLCRGEPSVLRAAAMGLVTLAGVGQGARAAGALRNLSIAVIVLCWADPWLSRSWGFALSVTASLGIVLWAGRWTEVLAGWLPRWVAESVAVPLSAQLATQPIVTALSGTVSLSGLPANALAGPFVGPVTVLGLATASVAWASPVVARPLAWLAGWGCEPILQVARRGSLLPGATTAWPATPVGLLLVLVGCLLLASAMPTLLRRWWFVLPAALILVAALLRPAFHAGWPPSGWLVMACDVGQGDATLIRAGEGQAVLVDTGPEPASLLACLDQAGVATIPMLVLTHYHADHIGGLEGLLRSRRVGVVLVSPTASPARTAAGVADAAARAGVSVQTARPGEVLSVGEVRWETLAAGEASEGQPAGNGESSAENNSSVVARATVAGLSVLVTGDVEPEAQDAIVARSTDVRATVLKVAHHGSGRQSPAFLAATGARIALIEVGKGNDYGHPALKTLRALEGLGMRVMRTDESGAIALSTRDGGVGVVTLR